MSEAWRNAPLAGETTSTLEAKSQKRAWEAAPIVAGKIPPPDPIPDKPWHSFATGAGRTGQPDAPELGTFGPDVPAGSAEGMRMLGAYALSADPQQVADIA